MYRFTESGAILRESDGAQIPCDPANRDYRAILESKEEIAHFVPEPRAPRGLTFDQLVDLVSYLVEPGEAEQPASETAVDDGVPAVFAELRRDGEEAEAFTARIRERWQYLKHIQMDAAKPTMSRALPDMTDEEKAELADLETRNKATKWLD